MTEMERRVRDGIKTLDRNNCIDGLKAKGDKLENSIEVLSTKFEKLDLRVETVRVNNLKASERYTERCIKRYTESCTERYTERCIERYTERCCAVYRAPLWRVFRSHRGAISSVVTGLDLFAL